MEIIACSAPDGHHDGVLERAPLSCLLPQDPHANWSAVWGADDRYYACRTAGDGAVRWYQIAEQGCTSGVVGEVGDGEVAGLILPAGAIAGSTGRGGAGESRPSGARGLRMAFRIRQGAGRGTTSLAIRVGRSRRPRS